MILKIEKMPMSHISHSHEKVNNQLFTSLSKALTIPACWFEKDCSKLEFFNVY